MGKKKFKDQCDECGQMTLCRGFDGRVLCQKCIDKEMKRKGDLYVQRKSEKIK